MTPLERLGREAAATRDALLDGRGHLRAVRARLLAVRPRRRPALVWVAWGAAAAAAAAVLLALGLPRSPEPLSFVTDGAPGRVGQWLTARESEALGVRFSDGTTIRLRDDASGRVERVDGRGARFLLERGSAELDVVHRAGSRWEIAVGPFEVLVVGTRFVVAWDPAAELFHLEMEEGAVTVDGPELNGRVVTAGQALRVSLSGRAATVWSGPRDEVRAESLAAADAPRRPRDGPGSERRRDGRDEPGGASSEAARPTPDGPSRAEAPRRPDPREARPGEAARGRSAATSGGAGPAEDSREPGPAAVDQPAPAADAGGPLDTEARDWRALAREGSYAEALAAADAAGWDGLLENSSRGELLFLGDTARLAGEPRRAAAAYERLRDRFGGSEAAATAAFHLGRIAFDLQGSPRRAARWFQTCLDEQPSGRFAREALGRLVEAELGAGDREGARAAARRYLAAYPDGPHARLARSVASGD